MADETVIDASTENLPAVFLYTVRICDSVRALHDKFKHTAMIVRRLPDEVKVVLPRFITFRVGATQFMWNITEELARPADANYFEVDHISLVTTGSKVWPLHEHCFRVPYTHRLELAALARVDQPHINKAVFDGILEQLRPVVADLADTTPDLGVCGEEWRAQARVPDPYLKEVSAQLTLLFEDATMFPTPKRR